MGMRLEEAMIRAAMVSIALLLIGAAHAGSETQWWQSWLSADQVADVDIGTAQCINTATGVVVFVRAQRHAMRAAERLGHVNGGLPFRGASGLGDLRIDHQAVAILH